MAASPVHHEHDEPRALTILYATETGNAQDVSERIAQHCRRLHFSVHIYSIDEYSMEEIISETLLVFVIATAGSGREPRSMTPFWTMLLRSDLPGDLFDHLGFAVFGLGDSAYEKFCWPAKLLSRRLVSLGATEIAPRGEADDQHHLGLDGALEPWMATLSPAFLELYPLPPGVDIIKETIPEPRISTEDGGSLEAETFEREGYYLATLTRNDRITAPDWFQDVRHFTFTFDQDLEFSPGDIAIVEPEISKADVESFLTCVGWANVADEPFTVKQKHADQSLPPHLPRVLTLRVMFTKYLNINAVPRRSFFALLRHFTTDELECEKLDEFLSPDGVDDLYDYCQSVRRTIREVLEEFRSAKIPREYVLDLFPLLRPREFSIASSIHRHPREIQLCVAIVQYRTKLKIPRRGVATTYLAALEPGAIMRVGIKKGLITLPTNKDTPIICIGPGTGIAPMRAVIEERILLGSTANTLYQGCRSGSKDQHYGSEFIDYEREEKLVYRVAKSRDGPPGVKRTYVQDLIVEDAQKIAELVGKQNAWVYISGSSNKMPAAVKSAIEQALQKYDSLNANEAKEFIAAMERGGRLVEDCWD